MRVSPAAATECADRLAPPGPLIETKVGSLPVGGSNCQAGGDDIARRKSAETISCFKDDGDVVGGAPGVAIAVWPGVGRGESVGSSVGNAVGQVVAVSTTAIDAVWPEGDAPQPPCVTDASSTPSQARLRRKAPTSRFSPMTGSVRVGSAGTRDHLPSMGLHSTSPDRNDASHEATLQVSSARTGDSASLPGADSGPRAGS